MCSPSDTISPSSSIAATTAAIGLRSRGRHQLQPVGGGLRPNGLLRDEDGLHGQSFHVLQRGRRPGRRLLLQDELCERPAHPTAAGAAALVAALAAATDGSIIGLATCDAQRWAATAFAASVRAATTSFAPVSSASATTTSNGATSRAK